MPVAARGGWFGFRNDTPGVLIVQQSTVVKSKVCPGRPLLLYPGEMTWDSVMQPGERSIAIYDPRQPQRPLYEKKVTYGAQDLLFAVKPGTGGQVRFEKTSLPVMKKTGR